MIQTLEKNEAPAPSACLHKQTEGVQNVLDFFSPMPIAEEHLEILAPRQKMHLLDWMETYFILPAKSSRIKGPWSSSVTPYWRTVIDWLCDLTTRVIWVLSATQAGKSTVMAGWMGYIIDVDPGPTKMVLPDEKSCKKRIKRLKGAFEKSPRVLAHMGGDVNNLNIGEPTDLDNMMLTLGWPRSPGTLADDPCRYIGGDEVCEWAEDIRDDTDPISKLDNRVRTFETVSKQFYTTSPKNKGDLADKNFESCQKWDIWLPCPHCGKFSPADFFNVKLDKDDKGELMPARVYKKGGLSRYVCPQCDKGWTELERKAAVSGYKACPEGCSIGENGEIVGDYEESPYKAITIPAVLVDPMFTTIDSLAADWANAMSHKKAGNIRPFRNFWNNQLARVWEEKERQTDMNQLKKHISSYKLRQVPGRCQILTCGIDVQADHVWVTTKGYGYRNQQWLIDACRIEMGHTGRAENWKLVEDYILSEFRWLENDEIPYHIIKVAIDCRYQRVERDEESIVIYDFCLKFTPGFVVPIMGHGRERMRAAPYRVQKVAGKALNRFDLNVDMYKDRAWQSLFDKEKEPGPGYMHLPADLPWDYMRQFASEEQKVKRPRSGREIVTWSPKEGFRENHLWDCNGYADFAAEIAGVFQLQDVDVADYVAKRKKKQQARKQPQSSYWDGMPEL